MAWYPHPNYRTSDTYSESGNILLFRLYVCETRSPLKVWSSRQGAHPSKFKWLASEFLVKGDSSTTYSQSYTTASKIFLVFPLVFKVVGYTIHPGDTITFYVDKSKKGIYIKTFGQPSQWDSFESEGVVYTEGLIVNGETIASPVVVSFTRTWLDTIGGMVGILFYLAIALFTFDYCWWYRQKEIDTKLTSFFANRNRFIQ